jgi:hypothetical protein
MDYMATAGPENTAMIWSDPEKKSCNRTSHPRQIETNAHLGSSVFHIFYHCFESLYLAPFDPGAQPGIFIGGWNNQCQIKQSTYFQFSEQPPYFRFLHPFSLGKSLEIY